MGKKKKNLIYEFDKEIDQKYMGLLEEIQFMQADIRREERKAKRKAMKKMRKGNLFYDTGYEVKVRQEIIHEMEGTDFFTRVTKAIEDLRPICIIIAKLVMSLIVTILSVDAVKYRINKDTLGKIDAVYALARKVSMA